MGEGEVMNQEFTFLSKLRSVLAEGLKYDIDVTEITVHPMVYNNLKAEVIATARSYDVHINGADVLRVYDTVIKKRECKGCCKHD